MAARNAAVAQAQTMSQRYEQVRLSATVMQQALLASSLPVLARGGHCGRVSGCGGGHCCGRRLVRRHPCRQSVVFVVGGCRAQYQGCRGDVAASVGMRLQVFQGLGSLSALPPSTDSVRWCRARSRPRSASVPLMLKQANSRYCTAGHPRHCWWLQNAGCSFSEPSGAGPLGRGATVTEE